MRRAPASERRRRRGLRAPARAEARASGLRSLAAPVDRAPSSGRSRATCPSPSNSNDPVDSTPASTEIEVIVDGDLCVATRRQRDRAQHAAVRPRRAAGSASSSAKARSSITGVLRARPRRARGRRRSITRRTTSSPPRRSLPPRTPTTLQINQRRFRPCPPRSADERSSPRRHRSRRALVLTGCAGGCGQRRPDRRRPRGRDRAPRDLLAALAARRRRRDHGDAADRRRVCRRAPRLLAQPRHDARPALVHPEVRDARGREQAARTLRHGCHALRAEARESGPHGRRRPAARRPGALRRVP